jgi:long-chain fatty acid transport protein
MRIAFKKKLIPAALAAMSLSGASGAYAAGFALLEQNASGLGNAYAGSGAVAADASTIFFNPAGMTLLPGMQVVASGAGVNLQTEFNASAPASQTSSPAPVFAVPLGTGDGGDAGGFSFVPALYFSAPVGERWAVGLGVGAPFGLKTEYDDDWQGRFLGIESEVKTINVNPSVAFKVNDNISLGAGINWQQLDATLTNAVIIGPGTEGRTELEADADAWGWNIGALFSLGTDMRLGLSYRSSVDYSLDGNVTTKTPTGAVFASGTFPAEADIELPDSVLVSVVQRFGDKWQLLGDLQWTHWSTIGSIDVVDKSTGRLRDQLALDFDDAWRVALGVNYFSSEKWTFRGGIAWDQSPVNDENRTVRLPDNDRFWVALGVQYKFGKGGALDIGYAHLFLQSPDINQTKQQVIPAQPPALPFAVTVTNNVRGDYDSSVDIIGVQLTWTF